MSSSAVSIVMTLYGAGVVFIVLIGTFLTDLTGIYSPCVWMCVAVAALTPLTWDVCQFVSHLNLKLTLMN